MDRAKSSELTADLRQRSMGCRNSTSKTINTRTKRRPLMITDVTGRVPACAAGDSPSLRSASVTTRTVPGTRRAVDAC